MRWPWTQRPGEAFVSNRELIRLLRQALRAAELHTDVVQVELQTARLQGEAARLETELLLNPERCPGCQPVPADVVPLAAALAAALDGRAPDAHRLVAEAVRGPQHGQVAALVGLVAAVLPAEAAVEAADQVRAVLLAAAEVEP